MAPATARQDHIQQGTDEWSPSYGVFYPLVNRGNSYMIEYNTL